MITVVGSSNTDFSVKTKALPLEGQTVLGGDFVIAAGGKGANQAAQAARLGVDVVFVARIGRDYFGDRSIGNFKKARINTDYIIRDTKMHSGAALIVVDKRGNNQIVVAPGSNGFLSASDVNKARGAIRRSKALLLQLEIPLEAVEKAVDVADRTKTKVILNPAPFRRLDKGFLRRVDVLVPNETEAQGFSGIKIRDVNSALRAARFILKEGCRSVIITLGSLGCVVVGGDSAEHLPAPKVKVIDTTAAGDSFCGALAVSIAEGKDLIAAAHFANSCAAISVTRFGAQPSLPTRREINRSL